MRTRDGTTGVIRGHMWTGGQVVRSKMMKVKRDSLRSSAPVESLRLAHSYPHQTWRLQDLDSRVGRSRKRMAEYKSKLMIKTSQVDGRR